MGFADDLKAALDSRIPANQLHYWDNWRNNWYRSSWAGKGGKPLALILHHTAGAATSSTNPDNAGNQHGANDGQIKYVARHPSYGMPCSVFSLDRDGCITVNAALPCYHAGEGSFRATRDARLDVCKACDRLTPHSHQCRECNCFMAAKTWLIHAQCPLGKW